MSLRSLTTVTYNLQLSKHVTQLVTNITKLAAQGTQVFCLQEVVKYADQPFILDILLKKLGPDWQELHHLGTELSPPGMGNAILWNTRTLQLKASQKLLLPPRAAMAPHELLFAVLAGGHRKPFVRRSLTATFQVGKSTLQVSSLHLDQIGGANHRAKQLQSVLSRPEVTNSSAAQLICGDFNNFDLLNTHSESHLQNQLFGSEYTEAGRDIGWTADLYNIDLDKAWPILTWAIKLGSLHVRKRLDRVWVKGLTVESCQKLEWPGSDHFPIITTLQLP